MSVNFAKNQDDITGAWRKVVDEKDKPNWALYSYEGNTNVIKLMSTGSNGLDSLVQELNCSLIQYAFCRVIETENNVNKLILINWQGDSAPLSRKGLCASHTGDVANYFKGATQTITIRNDDEATVDYLMAQIIKSRPNRIDSSISKQATQLEETISSNNSMDHPTTRQVELGPNVGAQIAKDRKTFWQIQEEEERLRLAEEKKRAAEKQAQFEMERTLREQSEAKKLAETVKERDRFIEATRNAERRESASSMSSNHSSFTSFNTNNQTNDNNDDDERVGRRSELIRLERNQETQSLISKGQIKNRRALFERASQETTNAQVAVSNSSTLSRRASGAMIKKRLDAFQSMDQGQSSTKTVEKIADRINNFRINEKTKPESNVIVTSAIESVKLTNNDVYQNEPKAPITPSKPTEIHPQPEQKFNISPTKEPINGTTNQDAIVANGTSKSNIVQEKETQHEEVAVIDREDDEETASDYQRELEQTKKAESCSLQKRENGNSNAIQTANSNGNGFKNHHEPSQSPSPQQNDATKSNGAGDFNENNNHITVTKSPDELHAYKKIVEALMADEDESDKAKPKAVAIYDYQAADKTEISFDPNDLIGFIEKVDVGWWHGVVLSGKYSGQRGLFPHNHVMEF